MFQKNMLMILTLNVRMSSVTVAWVWTDVMGSARLTGGHDEHDGAFSGSDDSFWRGGFEAAHRESRERGEEKESEEQQQRHASLHSRDCFGSVSGVNAKTCAVSLSLDRWDSKRDYGWVEGWVEGWGWWEDEDEVKVSLTTSVVSFSPKSDISLRYFTLTLF